MQKNTDLVQKNPAHLQKNLVLSQKNKLLWGVNFLFLVVLCLQLSNLLFMWLPQFVRMILNELLFIFLPAYIYLRLTRQPIAKRVRWNWPGWRITLPSLLIGMGLYPLSAASAGILATLLGYTNLAAPADATPTTVLTGVLAVIAYAVMAPLCEEFLFRGVIQPAYEQRGPKWAVYFVGALFVAFHLSLLQGLSIILLALALGLVNYRTRSLPASMLTHFGANAMAALVITAGVFKTGIQTWIFSIPVILGGLLIAGAALAGLLWLTRRPAVEAGIPDASLPDAGPVGAPAQKSWLAWSWPLLAAGLLYLGMIGAEVYYSRLPQAPAQPLQIGSTPWHTAQTWVYEIRNAADTVVGEGECQVNPNGAQMQIICTSAVEAYEVKMENSTFSSSGGTRTDSLIWEAFNGRLLSGTSVMNLQDGSYGSEITWSVEAEGIDIHMTVTGEAEKIYSLPLSDTPLAEEPTLLLLPDYTWPWQLAGLTLEEGGGSAVRFNAFTWRNETQDSGPLAQNRLVSISGTEEVATPAGQFTTWKVMLGSDQIAWYDASGNCTPVKFANGIETWYLKE